MLDLSDPGFLADPYPALNEFRERSAIAWNESSGQWIVTRWADVHAALRDRRLGRVYTHRYTHEQLGRPGPDPRWADFEASERWSLLNLEPPDHTRLRTLIAKVFTPTAVAGLRPSIEATADAVLEPLLEAGSFDVVTEYAQRYSVAVICDMLGVPRSETQHLLDWSHAIVKMYELTGSDDQRAEANRAAAEFIGLVKELIAHKRQRPDAGLVSQLVAVEAEGQRLTTDEIICTTIVLLNAGHEATVNTLGNGLYALARHPEQWRRLTTGEVAPRTAVEEMIRYDGPLQLFERWVLDEGVEIAGQPLRVGDEIAMLFGAANHDPRQFADPDRFDIGRGDTTHVGFGGGLHFCIGAPLARLEIEVSVAALVRHLDELRMAVPPVYHPTFVIRGLTGLRLTTT